MKKGTIIINILLLVIIYIFARDISTNNRIGCLHCFFQPQNYRYYPSRPNSLDLPSICIEIRCGMCRCRLRTRTTRPQQLATIIRPRYTCLLRYWDTFHNPYSDFFFRYRSSIHGTRAINWPTLWNIATNWSEAIKRQFSSIYMCIVNRL